VARLVGAWLVLTVGAVLLFRVVDPPTTAFMLARRLQASQAKEKGFTLRQSWVPLSRISPNLQLAFIAGEDQKFAGHWGFDVQAIEDAMEDHLEGRSSRGASTLTQQVAKNLFLWGRRSWVRKGLEAYFTVLLELLWPKRRILEVHLNVAELGNGLYGVEAAARTYFGKPASAVTAQEAAALAAVLPNPRARRVTAPSAAVQERAEWIADQARRLPPDTLSSL
jgi:monofunctional biosynthetic peptidoglycan transglycosylase